MTSDPVSNKRPASSSPLAQQSIPQNVAKQFYIKKTDVKPIVDKEGQQSTFMENIEPKTCKRPADDELLQASEKVSDLQYQPMKFKKLKALLKAKKTK